MSTREHYPITIHPLSKKDGGGFLAKVPDLPGCVADGETIEEALHEVEGAIDAWIKTAQEFGDKVPTPSLSESFSGEWKIQVPKHLHAALVIRAKDEGVSLNMLTATLLAESMGAHSNK